MYKLLYLIPPLAFAVNFNKQQHISHSPDIVITKKEMLQVDENQLNPFSSRALLLR
jgi:hypothetical protein